MSERSAPRGSVLTPLVARDHMRSQCRCGAMRKPTSIECRRLPGHHMGQSRLAEGYRQSVGVNTVSGSKKSAMISLHRRTPAERDSNFITNVNRIRSPSVFDSIPPTYSLVTSLYRRMVIHLRCGVISLADC